MATVNIPPHNGRTIPGMPHPSRRTGADRIQGMVYQTLTSLPQQEVALRLDATPSAAQFYPITKDVNKVIALRGIAVPKLPDSLLSLRWVIREQPDGMGARRFDEDGVARACSLPHDFLQLMIREQLKGDRETIVGQEESEGNQGMEEQVQIPEKSLRAALQLEINEDGTHKCDIALTAEKKPYSFFEFKTSLSAGASCWNHPVFMSSPRTCVMSMDYLTGSVPNMISQLIFYAKCILKILERPKGKLLVALVLPPTRFHYVLVDLGSGTVTITENVIVLDDMNPEDPDYISKAIRHLVNPDSWTEYWKQALWFHLVALYFNDAELIRQTVAADALREADQRRLPDGILQSLQREVQALCTIPSAGSWTGLLVENAGMAMSWARRFGDRFRNLWMSLAWMVLGAEGVLPRSRHLQVPNEATLTISDPSESRTWNVRLPQGVISRSHCGKKRVYIYRDLKLVIKVFEPALMFEFEAEVKAYDRLFDLQGKVVPILYASGKMERGLGSFLACSYEGEPQTQWSVEDRMKIQGLVAHIHSYGVHHHDIAPRNVVVDSTGKYSLIDLGLSTLGCNGSPCNEVAEWATTPDEVLPYSM